MQEQEWMEYRRAKEDEAIIENKGEALHGAWCAKGQPGLEGGLE